MSRPGGGRKYPVERWIAMPDALALFGNEFKVFSCLTGRNDPRDQLPGARRKAIAVGRRLPISQSRIRATF